MTTRFDYFVVLAEMRTGSNFLEANLNAFDSFQCHGEAFNPHFIGYPNKTEIIGVTREMRDADPLRLIDTIKKFSEGMGGFRYFHDHDPRVLDIVLDDPRCAKIILTRNPLDSYVSHKIAKATGQWKLTNVKRRKDSKIAFDVDEFNNYVNKLQQFQVQLLNRLQVSGQSAFYIAYEDLQSLDIMNGLARFLGADEVLEALDSSLKKQNPSPLSDKVSNFTEMEQLLAGSDPFNLTRTPNFEPRRGPGVPGFVTAATAPLLYMPVRSGPEDEVLSWLAVLDGVMPDDLGTKHSQKTLRQWKRAHPGHRSFTVLRHPLERAHAAFCTKILPRGPGTFAEIRKNLRNFHKLPIPGPGPTEDYSPEDHRAAFFGFLTFLKANLAGQTGIRVDAHWASQSEVLRGMSDVALPDLVLRESDLATQLPQLAAHLGYEDAPLPAPAHSPGPYPLSEIYDDEIEDLAAQIYQRDYLSFGFARWG